MTVYSVTWLRHAVFDVDARQAHGRLDVVGRKGGARPIHSLVFTPLEASPHRRGPAAAGPSAGGYAVTSLHLVSGDVHLQEGGLQRGDGGEEATDDGDQPPAQSHGPKGAPCR